MDESADLVAAILIVLLGPSFVVGVFAAVYYSLRFFGVF